VGRFIVNGLLLAAGFFLLYWVFSLADPAAAFARAESIGLGAFAAVMAVFIAGYLVDVWVWIIALGPAYRSPRWFWRLFKTRLLGDAINISTPVAGFGGEPAKAWVLKRRYDVPYVKTITSMVLTTTVTVVGLVCFLAVGLVLLIASPSFPADMKLWSGIAFGLLSGGIAGFLLVQRFKLTSAIAAWAHGRTGFAWLERAAEKVAEVDNGLVDFYRANPTRLLGLAVLGTFAYAVSIGEVYIALAAMGAPVSLADAWIIEAAAQLVRAVAFMIPGALGVQDGAFIWATAVITGQPQAGAAVALVRRAREIVWVCAGAASGLCEYLAIRRAGKN